MTTFFQLCRPIFNDVDLFSMMSTFFQWCRSFFNDVDLFSIMSTFLMMSTFSFSGLRERDRFSRTTTPVCILYVKSRGSRQWKEVGRTEKIENTLDPGVNFIVVKRSNFSYKRHFSSFFSSYMYVVKAAKTMFVRKFRTFNIYEIDTRMDENLLNRILLRRETGRTLINLANILWLTLSAFLTKKTKYRRIEKLWLMQK
jgi:hypothetical protein